MSESTNPFNYFIAFDVSKEHLDYHFAPNADCGRISNSKKAIIALLKQHLRCLPEGANKKTLIVCEATGGYERNLIEAATSLKLSLHRAEGRRVRLFAQSQGQRAKTDPLDAWMIYEYSRHNKDLRLYQAPAVTTRQLACLIERREELLQHRLAEECRMTLAEHKLVRQSLRQSIAFTKKQLKTIETEIDQLMKRSDELARKNRLMQSLAGVGRITAATLLASMPELGTLSKGQAAALAGLAPYNQDSGKSNQRRHIQGGRFKVRRVLYMAAMVAIRHNPILKEKFEQLTKRGKPFKVAIAAIMRKIIVILNTMLKENQPWKHAKIS